MGNDLTGGVPTQLAPASRTLAACCCSPRPIIGMNEHWTTLTWRARWLEHGGPSGARVSRNPTAGSHHSYRVDSATRRFRANCIVEVFFNISQKGPGTDHTRL